MGRRARPLSERLRASLWAFHVQLLSKGKSWEELDELLLAGRLSPRHDNDVFSLMRRIALNGDAPEHVRCGARGYLNLVNEAEPHFPTASANYRSPIWELLRLDDSPSGEVLNQFSREALERLGLMQPSLGHCSIAEEFYGSQSPFAVGNLSRIGAGASQLAVEGNLDALMVCAIQARLAISRWAFNEAHIYADALRECGRKYEKETVKGLMSGMLVAMLGRRVVQNDWRPLHPGFWPRPRSILKGTSREAHDENAGFLYEGSDDEMGPFSVSANDVKGGVPIVANSEAKSTISKVQRSWREFLNAIPQQSPGQPSEQEKRAMQLCAKPSDDKS